MLYPYKYPKAKIQNLQSFVNYIMLEVVLRARKISAAEFSVSFVIPKYVPLVIDINDDYVLTPISEMYKRAKKLDSFHLRLLRKAIYENNKIEELCEGTYTPISYKYLESCFKQDFEVEMLGYIKTFCTKLYEKCLSLKPIYDRYGKLKDYHDILVQDDDRCHCCGNTTLVTKYATVRNAFDHYLAKQTYPFVSVNFKNLVPSCYVCNTSYKRTKDVLFFRGKRQRVFYPFTSKIYTIKFQVIFKPSVIYTREIKPEDLNIQCFCVGHQKETDNWMRIYSIQERYKSKCCSKAFKADLERIIDEASSKKRSVEENLSLLEDNIEGDMNFIKVPFFKAALETLKVD